MSEAKFDPHRRLCPDGACIGVIGSDGRCRVCGRTASGDKSAPAGFAASAPEDAYGDEDEVEDGKVEAQATGAGAAFDPNRRLCPDGSCLGVIGADGICNVCGQKAG